MAGKIAVGTSVLYQPTPAEAPMGGQQLAAIVTGWNEDSEKASLVVFAPGAGYVIARGDVAEGTADGSFQQTGVLSDRAKATQEAEKAAQAAEKAAQEQSKKSAATAHASR